MTDEFTPDQVVALDQYQRGEGGWSHPLRRMHPFTCTNRGDGKHREVGGDLGALFPTVRGWICPFCDYTQAWAHPFMSVPPPDFGPEDAALAEKIANAQRSNLVVARVDLGLLEYAVRRVLDEWHECGDGGSVDPPLVDAINALKALVPND